MTITKTTTIRRARKQQSNLEKLTKEIELSILTLNKQTKDCHYYDDNNNKQHQNSIDFQYILKENLKLLEEEEREKRENKNLGLVLAEQENGSGYNRNNINYIHSDNNNNNNNKTDKTVKMHCHCFSSKNLINKKNGGGSNQSLIISNQTPLSIISQKNDSFYYNNQSYPIKNKNNCCTIKQQTNSLLTNSSFKNSSISQKQIRSLIFLLVIVLTMTTTCCYSAPTVNINQPEAIAGQPKNKLLLSAQEIGDSKLNLNLNKLASTIIFNDSNGKLNPSAAAAVDEINNSGEMKDDDELAIAEALLFILEQQDTINRRRLSKRSGISDQRLAEIQMIRALKKQLVERASKLAATAAASTSSSSSMDGQDNSSASETSTNSN